jgi:glycerol kinase
VADGRPDPARLMGLLPTVAWDVGAGATYAVDGGVYDVGSVVEWAIREGLAQSLDDFAGFQGSSAIERGLVCVPAFSGLAAPVWNRSAVPLLAGFGFGTGLPDIRRALLEGIALLIADVLDAMAAAAGRPAVLSVDGGLARNRGFLQFLADCSGQPLFVASSEEMTAIGVATMAAEALGIEVARRSGPSDTIAPANVDRAAWRARFHRARDMATSVR